MKNQLLAAGLFLMLMLCGCNKQAKLDVSGTIAHGEKKILYFELFGMDKVQVLDSAILDESGTFHFKTELPEYPEFYRLRIDKRFIHLAADSSANVQVSADAFNFGQSYRLTGSKSCENIRILAELQDKSVMQINEVEQQFKNKELNQDQYREKALQIFDNHRQIARSIVLEDPHAPSAYFALFQRIHDYLVFDPYNPEDNKCFAAVATSWDVFYPNSLRSKHLKLLTLQGMKEIRKKQSASKIKIVEKEYLSAFQVKLPNIFGKEISLSTLKDKVVLLDFTAYKSDFSASRNLYFRELYQSFSGKGFEIYQISYDSNEQFWKTSANNLPWICVHDGNGNASENLRNYNVQNLPTYFIINKKGEIIKRDNMVQDLKSEIQGLL